MALFCKRCPRLGVPELQIHSAMADSIFFSWTVPSGSVVDRYQIIWEINQDPLVTFRDSLLPVSFNNYTVTGLQGYGDPIVSITVTAYNSAGSATSSSMNVAANCAAGNSECPNHQVSSTNSDGNDVAIIGAVVGGFDILAVAVVVVAVLIYRYKSKSRKNQKKPVYK